MCVGNIAFEHAGTIALEIFIFPPSDIEKNGEFALFSRRRRRILNISLQMGVLNVVLEIHGSISFEIFTILPAVFEKTPNLTKFRGGGGECFVV